MARSRVGGSSAKLSGLLGSVVFTIGKTSDGGYEQYISAYNPEKENLNTKYQALARMIIATIERMVHVLTPVLRASFEGVPVGVTSVNEFAKLNMKSIQDYCRKYWFNAYGWSFPVKGNPLNCWAPLQISYGSMKTPKAWSVEIGSWPTYIRTFVLQLPNQRNRVVDIRRALGISRQGSFNIVCMIGDYQVGKTGACFVKGTIDPSANDTEYLDRGDIRSKVNIETRLLEAAGEERTNIGVNVNYNPNTHRLTFQVIPQFYSGYQWITYDTHLHATIFSDYKKGKWVKSVARLSPHKVFEPDEEFGRAPFEAFTTWDSNYNDESYEEYFGRR